MLRDSRYFDEDHIPQRLLHRDAEQSTLSRALDPVVRGEAARDVLISGPSGVGKTTLARHSLQRLPFDTPAQTAYIACAGDSPAEIIQDVVAAHRAGYRPTESTPLTEATTRLREIVDGPFVVVLDEAGSLPTGGVLARLVEIPLVSVVAICHDPERWLSRVDNAIAQRFEPAYQIRVDRFGVDELVDILSRRADRGLFPDAVAREQLARIADETAGVARYGIESLRAAAELARERQHQTITDDDVERAFGRARRRIRESNLASLSLHHQVAYELLRQGGELAAGEVHDRYDELADVLYHDRKETPVGERQRLNALHKLKEYDLIDWAGSTRHRRYWVTDPSIEAPIDIAQLAR